MADPTIFDVDLDAQSGDEGRVDAAKEAAKVCKRAGVPDLVSEALPSTIVLKLMQLGFWFKVFFPTTHPCPILIKIIDFGAFGIETSSL